MRPQSATIDSPSRRLLVLLPPSAVMVLCVSWFAAFNLRSGFIGLGPALPTLTADLGLSFSQASVLAAIPTLMMGLMAIPGGTCADHWGPARVITLGLALVTCGGLRAAAPVFPLLLAVTVVFGAGIGLSQPSLPRLMRMWFPQRLGVSTGIYASGMITGSVVAASVTGPLLAWLNRPDAWRTPLALWGATSALTLLIWVVAMRPWRAPRLPVVQPALGVVAEVIAWSPWRHRSAWLAAAYFAAQGLIYYLLVAWLPAIYGEAGVSPAATAGLFVVFNGSTLPAIVLFPSWSDRIGRRRPLALTAGVMVLAGIVGLLVLPVADPWRWLWPFLLGCGVSGAFAMSLVMPADLAPRGRTGAAAGMVLAIGYTGSALGPILAGVVRDVTGSFHTTLLVLPAIAVAMIGLATATPELVPRGRSLQEGDAVHGEQ